jgi:hypothetical protein
MSTRTPEISGPTAISARHLGLLSAYQGELASQRLESISTQPYCTRRDNGTG